MDQSTPSFAFEVKEEIAKKEWDLDSKKAILSSFSKINGGLRISRSKESLELSTSSSVTAKALYSYLSEAYEAQVRFAYTKGIGVRKRVKYHVLADNPAPILEDLEVDFFSNSLPKKWIEDEKLSSAYIAGAFLASGSINSPKSSNYHFEFSFQDEEYSKWFLRLLSKAKNNRFTPKLTTRRGRYIVYMKKSEEISEMLALMGAASSCLKFENIRVDRDFQNLDSRLYNIDSANMAKTIKSSEKQLLQIRYFQEEAGMDKIKNPKLAILMKIRLEHPDASMNALAVYLSEETASTVSKSNVNHLFRRLDEEYRRHHG